MFHSNSGIFKKLFYFSLYCLYFRTTRYSLMNIVTLLSTIGRGGMGWGGGKQWRQRGQNWHWIILSPTQTESYFYFYQIHPPPVPNVTALYSISFHIHNCIRLLISSTLWGCEDDTIVSAAKEACAIIEEKSKCRRHTTSILFCGGGDGRSGTVTFAREICFTDIVQ
jgi:hypothetical protein